jgi:hypothetical protein
VKSPRKRRCPGIIESNEIEDEELTVAELLASGAVRKMKTRLAEQVQYTAIFGGQEVDMNQYLGKSLRLDFQGAINCVHCDRKTNKSFNQGYCYPCFKRLASTTLSIWPIPPA